ncbi:translocation/assembly module TamB domain-containing protein [Verrucomicrobiaceae bacterium R5-34]|nr:translocation/assembly module TamB domain-containing protein [Verrucomicrobiaceae bacterium R5-34]
MTDTTIIDSEVEPPPENESEESSSRRRKSTRKKIWVLVVLLAICFVVNGPLARWLVLYGLDKGLAAQGMSGRAEVSGTLSSGFVIHDLSYAGERGIQTLNISEVSARYQFSELFSGKVRDIGLRQGEVVIDIDRFQPSADEEEKEPSSLQDTLKTIHPWIDQSTIQIDQLDVTILKSSELQAQFTLDEFSHQADSQEFDLRGFVATDQAGRTTPEQDIHIVWRPEAASIDRLEILPEVAVENVSIDWTGDFQGEGKLEFLQSQLNVKVAETITARLSEGNIDSKSISKRFDLELPAEFSLAGLELTIKDWQQPIPEWDIRGDAEIASADYEDYHLKNTTLSLRQQSLDYEVTVKGRLNNTASVIDLKGTWLSPESETWWSHTKADYHVSVPELGSLTQLIDGLPSGLDLETTGIDASGSLSLDQNTLSQGKLTGTISGVQAQQTTLPQLNLTANYKSEGPSTVKLTGSQQDETVMALNASYDLKSQDYQADFEINTANTAWMNALAEVFDAQIRLQEGINLSWSGRGNAADLSNPKTEHQGSLKIEKLHLQVADAPAIAVTTEANYQWPDAIHLESLTVLESEWKGQAALKWNGKEVDISQVKLWHGEELVAEVSGTTPYRADIRDAQQFFAQKTPWKLTIASKPLALKKWQQWLDIEALKDINGSSHFDLQIAGSPSQPSINGSVGVNDVKGVDDGSLQPLNVSLSLASDEQLLKINGKLLEGTTERFALEGSAPFQPSDWLNDPDFIDQFAKDAALSAELQINTLDLSRFKSFVPQLEKLTGTLSGKASFKGTIEDPVYVVNLDANVPLIQLKEKGIGDIKDIQLNTQFDQQQKATLKLTAQVNGGKFEAGGSVDLSDYQKPGFDLFLRTQYALIHRDDMVSVRANSDLKLTGNLEDATLSGSIGIAESLFYKDIELIPIGVPSSEVAKVQMPALSKKKADDRLPIPEPFNRWKLDLTVRTDDPVLIRGNVASGNLSGSIKVGGTLEKPAPQGTILINRVRAKLPFSILEIRRGEVNFDPKNGLNPTLNIRGKSTVGSYDVSVFVYGSANAPKTAFTSYPPLPENEVMTLLATGTTTSGLENQSVATFKAFQVFLMKLQQRNEKPGGNKLFKTLLSGIEDLNLNVGETDPFTGRKFSSATIEMNRHWNFTAQVDDTQQTRGLIVYVIRFR